ncbi:hypothetical protein BK120_23655 [Paenibacillus sp. FSL A5-0031]|nr:hypothetical protein BK120_23655 [Paenibacillus sp. FSL A5-0031]
MYSFFNEVSSFFSEPFRFASQSNIALLAALFLGIIGSVAPCQISANVAAITYFSNRHIQSRLSWQETAMYILGKVFLFSLLGMMFWLFGHQLSIEFIPLFSFSRKLLGPLLILFGIILLGGIRLTFNIGTRISSGLQKMADHIRGSAGAFLMGVAFSIGFCPTMFILFFGSLMPLALQTSYGIVLPSIFAFGTAMPYLLFTALAVGFGLDKAFVKRTKRWGGVIQKLTGSLFLVLGVSDTLTYWAF